MYYSAACKVLTRARETGSMDSVVTPHQRCEHFSSLNYNVRHVSSTVRHLTILVCCPNLVLRAFQTPGERCFSQRPHR